MVVDEALIEAVLGPRRYEGHSSAGGCAALCQGACAAGSGCGAHCMCVQPRALLLLELAPSRPAGTKRLHVAPAVGGPAQSAWPRPALRRAWCGRQLAGRYNTSSASALEQADPAPRASSRSQARAPKGEGATGPAGAPWLPCCVREPAGQPTTTQLVHPPTHPPCPAWLSAGQLGDVLEESARIALSWVRAHAAALGLPGDAACPSRRWDVHIHLPAGAVLGCWGQQGAGAGVGPARPASAACLSGGWQQRLAASPEAGSCASAAVHTPHRPPPRLPHP